MAEGLTKLNKLLIERFLIERRKFDRSGIYALTQRRLAYNSNKIEGSTLTEEQTLSLFETGQLPVSDDVYRAKDIEEMQGHFAMFNRMVDTLNEPLSEELIKEFHFELKSGVFEDRANGYAIGEYKTRPNRIGMHATVLPNDVPAEMGKLLEWYHGVRKPDIQTMAEFHARYESIHPFQDGNGRTGRMILFRECLINGIIPLIIEDKNRMEYVEALSRYQNGGELDLLVNLFQKEQEAYLAECLYFFPELT